MVVCMHTILIFAQAIYIFAQNCVYPGSCLKWPAKSKLSEAIQSCQCEKMPGGLHQSTSQAFGIPICFRDSAASKKGCLGLGCTSLCREAPGLQEALEAPQRKRHGPVCAPASHSQLGLGCDWFRENLYIFPGG